MVGIGRVSIRSDVLWYAPVFTLRWLPFRVPSVSITPWAAVEVSHRIAMRLSVVTLWSDFSPIHAGLARYFLEESFPVPTRFVWVVNTDDRGRRQFLYAAANRLRTSGHHVDLAECSDKPGDGFLHNSTLRIFLASFSQAQERS